MSYSPIAQINESIDFDASGKIQRQNVLLNIREDSVEAAYNQYVALRELILNGSGEKKINGNGEKKVVEAMTNSLICDDCGKILILREGRGGQPFFGCEGYPNCRFTKTAIKPGANQGKIGTGKKENDDSPVPECPRHKIKMWLKSRRSDGQLFFGCAMFDSKGCLESVQYPAQRQANVKIPSVSY